MLNISTDAAPGKTLNATLKRLSDGYYWNPTAEAWQAAPSFANKAIALTEGEEELAGHYAVDVEGLGDAGEVEAFIHDAGLSNRSIGSETFRVMDGEEVPPFEASPPDNGDMVNLYVTLADGPALKGGVEVKVKLEQASPVAIGDAYQTDREQIAKTGTGASDGWPLGVAVFPVFKSSVLKAAGYNPLYTVTVAGFWKRPAWILDEGGNLKDMPESEPEEDAG
jgi:hypothetical protein